MGLPFRLPATFFGALLLAAPAFAQAEDAERACFQDPPLPREQRLTACELFAQNQAAPARRRSEALAAIAAAMVDADHRQAIHLYGQALAADPANARALAGRAALYEASGYNVPALIDISQAMLADPSLPGLFTIRGRLRQALNDNEGALADFAQAIERDPRDYVALALQGMLIAQDDWAQAEALLRRSLEIEPNQVDTRLVQARLAAMIGRGAEAQESLGAMIRDMPQDWRPRVVRANVRIMMGDIAGARADAEQAAREHPRVAAPQAALSETLLAAGDNAGAMRAIDAAIRLDPDEEDYLYFRAVIHRSGARLQAALADIERAIASEPGSATMLAERCLIRARLRQPQALGDCDEAVEIDEDGPPRLIRAGVLALRGDNAGARTELTRATQLDPRSMGVKQALQAVLQRGRHAGMTPDTERQLTDMFGRDILR